ncbi:MULTISPECIES: isochorismate synthase [unclassified Agarivorans]|uniref:isochorismate synthase n=1 Tax=unclassified Agarivorans TaxID=2636026 RepID=UPI0026E34194|nr:MULTISPECIES: isochorismate synthase [unclassified Agarivorans]MDO6686621.1 isochorismate synthase [Agarivorans sp. 3_MG-2023]MDO6715439.1 isochorismate synthase [Agarivorans sp. 2_MG-2023]
MRLTASQFKIAINQLRQVPQQGFQQVCIKLPKLDLFAWLNQQQHTTRGYWKNKHKQQVAFVGAAKSILDLEQLQSVCDQLDPSNNQLRFYGGIAFARQSAQWSGFPHRRFILPRFEIRCDGEYTRLFINANFEHQPALEYQRIEKAFLALKPTQPLPQVSLKALSRQDQPSRAQWQGLVDQVTSEEFQQHTAKVVLSRQTNIQLNAELNAFALLQQWQQKEQNCYSFLFQFDGISSFLGCSPERLYSREGSQLVSEALAGTAPRGITPEQDAQLGKQLLDDAKNQLENQLVVDDLTRRLKELSLHVRALDQIELVKLDRVQHLKRRIQARVSPALDDRSLLQALHPTPAVGGLPRSSAVQYILKNEGYARGWYAGAVGWLSGAQSEFSVAIRSALVTPQHLSTFAGAGIVAGSQAEQEWQELNHKIATVLQLVDEDALLESEH